MLFCYHSVILIGACNHLCNPREIAPSRQIRISPSVELASNQRIMSWISRLAVVLCLVAAPSADALSSRRRMTPTLSSAGQLQSRTAAQLSTVTALRGGSVMSEHKLLSFVAYAVASTAAVGSAVALVGALLLLRWVQKPSLSASGLRSRRWKRQHVKIACSQQPMRPSTVPEAHPNPGQFLGPKRRHFATCMP